MEELLTEIGSANLLRNVWKLLHVEPGRSQSSGVPAQLCI